MKMSEMVDIVRRNIGINKELLIAAIQDFIYHDNDGENVFFQTRLKDYELPTFISSDEILHVIVIKNGKKIEAYGKDGIYKYYPIHLLNLEEILNIGVAIEQFISRKKSSS